MRQLRRSTHRASHCAASERHNTRATRASSTSGAGANATTSAHTSAADAANATRRATSVAARRRGHVVDQGTATGALMRVRQRAGATGSPRVGVDVHGVVARGDGATPARTPCGRRRPRPLVGFGAAADDDGVKRARFTATIEVGHDDVRFVVVPFDPRERWADVAPVSIPRPTDPRGGTGWPVSGTVANTSFVGHVGRRYGRAYLVLDAAVLRAADVNAGDDVEIVVAPLQQKRARAKKPRSFRATLFRFPGKGGWTFAPVPEAHAPPATHGWGRTPVVATVDGTTWKTSVWRDADHGTLLPVPKGVRGVKGDGDVVEVVLVLAEPP